MTGDLTPIITAVAGVIGALGSAMILWLGLWIKALLAQRYEINKATLNDQRQSTFDYAAERSLDVGRKLMGPLVNAGPITNTDHPVVAAAADYLQRGWPELVTALDMKPEQIKEGLLARATSKTQPTSADAIVTAKAAGVAPKPPE